MPNVFKVIVVAVFATSMFVGCSKAPEKKIIGEWQENGESESVQFFADGAIAIRDGNETMAGSYTFLDESKLRVELDGMGALVGSMVIEYQFDGDTLKLTGPDGSVADYTRLNGKPKSNRISSLPSDSSADVVIEQVTEGVHLSGGAKAAVSEYYMDKGVLPASNTEAGLSPAADIWGRYVMSVTVRKGVISVLYRAGGAETHESIAGKTLILTPETDSRRVSWSCSSREIEAEFLPPACR